MMSLLQFATVLREPAVRSLASSLLRTVNRVVAPMDAIFAANGDAPPPLFVMGPPRSGTTLLYQVITQSLEVGYITSAFHYVYGLPSLLCRLFARRMTDPEPCFESRYGTIPARYAPSEHAGIWYRWLIDDPQRGHHLAVAKDDEKALARIDMCLASMSRIVGRPMAFKNVYLTLSAGTLARLGSAPRFVRIRRDWLRTAESLYRARLAHGGSTRWWSVKPPGYRDWLQRPLWQQVCWQLIMTEKILDRELRGFEEQVMLVDFDRLCSRPGDVVDQLADWLEKIGYSRRRSPALPRCFRAPLHTPLVERANMRTFLSQLEEELAT